MAADESSRAKPAGKLPGDAAPEFQSRDPNLPGFWDERFERGFMPWDQAGAPPAFRAFAARQPGAAVLIPGCGSAYEAALLARAGHPVRAIDFSEAAVAAAKKQLGTHANVVEQADFFRYRPPFAPDWIYERAFLCALPPARRADWAARMAELLRPGALLAGFFFFDNNPKGPPFGIGRDELDTLLATHFDCVEDDAVTDSIPAFAGRERWIVWRRRSGAAA